MQIRPNRGKMTPQATAGIDIGWSRASSRAGEMSALCYYFGKQLVQADPSVPVGLMASTFSGTAIGPWMPAAAHATCSAGLPPAEATSTEERVDPGLGYLGGNWASEGAEADEMTPPPPTACAPAGCGSVCGTSCLWNSQIVPLSSVPVAAFLWYQGESDSGTQCGFSDCETYYSRCFPAMISAWRAEWHTLHPAMASDTPFLFVQLSAWPNGDRGFIAQLREGQLSALGLNATGMAVAADLSDPSGMWHPVHPPWKQEVAARLHMEAKRLLHGNKSAALRRPKLLTVTVDEWNPGWKDFHFGYGSVGGICGNLASACGRSPCFGVQLKFDMPLVLDGASEARRWRGAPSGFELGDTTGTQWQPMTLLDIRGDGNATVQLNATFAPFAYANGTVILPDAAPALIRYAWHDYPTMQVFSEAGRPVAPFKVSFNASSWSTPMMGEL